jgi:hypothetical protein
MFSSVPALASVLTLRNGIRRMLGSAALPAILAVAAAVPGRAQDAPQPPAGGVSAAELAKANNPLADANSINFQNYFIPSLYGLPDQSADALLLRPVMVAGRHIIRGTVPFQTSPTGLLTYESGIGDVALFDAIVLTSQDASTMFGIGPLVVAPTASDDALGAGKWQAGTAAVVVRPLPGGSMLAGLVTWQTDFAGDEDRADTNLLTAQPVGIFQIGGGYYVRSSGLWTFDLENDRYLVPFGVGVGKVFRVGKTVVNAFVEPQYSVFSKGEAQPQWQLFSGINLQWFKEK